MMSEVMLTTKLHIPGSSPAFVPRPRLSRKLDEGLHGKLILISAPAGFGKTTLVADWALALEQPVAWLSLDERDDELVRFWAYVVAALQRTVEGDIGNDVQQLLAASLQNNFESALITLINELTSLDTPVIFVLDDYHVISDLAIHESLAFMLDHLPPAMTLVLVTRADPPFPLARLRARGRMVEIRAADLRFRTDEAAAFMRNNTDISLDTDEIAALEGRTEGWAVGLQLAALAIKGYEDPSQFLEAFAGSHHYVVEYLMEEVINQQPDTIREFLLRTAILDELSAPLCDAVTGRDDSEAMLTYLIENNLFLISLDPMRTWYRYHHLLSDLLRHRLRRAYGEDAVQELCRRASRWYEQASQVELAIGYALSGGAYEDAARLLEAHWHSIAHRGGLRRVKRWLDSLPGELVEGSAPLNMAYCWLHYLSGEYEFVEARLEDVERAQQARTAAGAVPDSEAWAVIPSLSETMAAIIALQQDRPHRAVEHAQRALDLIPGQDERVDRDLLVGSAAYRLVQAYRQLGQVEKAVDTMRDVLVHLKRGRNYIGVANGVHAITQMYLTLGRPREAQEACEEALAYMEAQGQGGSPLTGMIHLAQAEVASSEGQMEAAVEHIDHALALAEPSRYAPVLELADALRARLDQPAAQPLLEPLTDREMDVLRLLNEGYTNQQIADELVITEDTVKRHNTHIYGKLEVSNRTQAVLRARELNLL